MWPTTSTHLMWPSLPKKLDTPVIDDRYIISKNIDDNTVVYYTCTVTHAL